MTLKSFLLLAVALPSVAMAGDSIPQSQPSRLSQMTCTGVPLIVGGLIAKGQDTHFRNLRNDYMPEFRRHADNYIQYLPLATLLGLKALGVESRSSWGRMIVSDAFATAIMGSVVQTMKHTTNVTRPDGTDRHSFPSGHTAMAFMTATMLTKEYGGKSPWIGIGAYTAATTTALMRVANNKHWLSDVLTGAGIGILSTEVGYWLGDLIFKDKGIHEASAAKTFDRFDRPSFLSLYVGMNLPVSKYDIDEQNEFRTSSGSTAGVEGAWFANPYVGIGGRATVSNTAIIVNGNRAEDDRQDAFTLAAGGYFSYPLTSRWAVGSKLLAGYVHYNKLNIVGTTVRARDGACFGSGLSTTFRENKNYAIRLFLDYNLLSSHSPHSAEWMSTLNVGTSFCVSLSP